MKVMKDIDKLHYCTTSESFETAKQKVEVKWKKHITLNQFRSYFFSQWLQGTFVNWQLFRRPVGCAITNSPIEAYNRTFKDFFTERERFNLVPAIEILENCLKFESKCREVFYDFAKPTKTIVSDARKMADSVTCVGDSCYEVAHVLNDRKVVFNVNLHRDEDDYCYCVECCNCNCSFFCDKAMCVHLIATCIIARHKFPGAFVSKAVHKTKPGRPKKAKNALSLD